MNRSALLFLYILLAAYVFISLAYLDKEYFICPTPCVRDYGIRDDSWGHGFFGARRGNGSRVHQGIDLLADKGAPVAASRSGWVIAARQSKGMGRYVIIRHRGGFVTIYGHLLQLTVRENQFVRQGQAVGFVGKTGNANIRAMHAHLHFEIRKDNVPVDPLEYLP
jgi:murein DD-endopeptidase MepM/ murein hydrolase activator NlpD